jgi:putative heme transporter
VLAGLYSGVTFTVVAVVALLGAPITRVPTAAVLGALTAVVLVMIVLAFRARRAQRSDGTHHGLRGWLHRRSPKLVEQLTAARGAIRLTRRDKLVLISLALTNWLLDVACLAAVCVALGVDVGAHKILLGYVAAKSAAALALLPGGLGVAEFGLGATILAGGVTGGTAAAVVFLYRLISFWGMVIAGWLAWVLLLEPVRTRLHSAAALLRRPAIRLRQAALAGYASYGFRLPPS